MNRFAFPKITNVVLRKFSLYSKNEHTVDINEKISKGVFCLAGANGLGKTTFLNAINYALTGLVLAPNKELLAPQDIFKENNRYTDRYFIGRISEEHKKAAEIELTFLVGKRTYKLIRGFANKDELRHLEIYEQKGKRKVSVVDTKDLAPQKLKQLYEDTIARDIGIKNFSYFVFFQLYVLTFDENRRMIFWDDRASSHTLSIAFNTSLKDAEDLIKIKRRMDKFESEGRNLKWQATQTSNRIDNLIKSSKDKSDEDMKEIEEEYLSIVKEFDEIEHERHGIQNEYDTLLKNQSYLNLEIMNLRLDHEKLFTMYSEPRSKLLNNTYIKLLIEKKECLVCSAKGDQIIEAIKNNLYKDHCPLCQTTITDEKENEQRSLLAKIETNDHLLAKKNAELKTIITEISGKKIELEKIEYEHFESRKKKAHFESEYNFSPANEKYSSSLNTAIENYKKQQLELEEKSKGAYEYRDKLIPEFNKLQKKIESAFKEAEVEFVPIFQRLAKSFIGFDLNIKFSTKKRDMKLILELKKKARTESAHLSESQRFFLDIALRMSLAIYLSKKGSEATMFIDTPEGSLDIAYESRVGKMFASYVKDFEQNIFMTANINASQLLKSLAEECGQKNMVFRRMLEWTDLSEVQREGEYLFDKVYNDIETALMKKG